jgi:TRAP transporter 4TM/12TM fusion protein
MAAAGQAAAVPLGGTTVSEVSTKALRPSFSRAFDAIGETRRVRPPGLLGLVVAAFSVLAVFLITWLALFGIATQHLQVSLFLVLLLPIAFLTTTASARLDRLTPIDLALAVASFAVSVWFAANEPRYANWMSGFTLPSLGDVIAGTTLLLLCIELCRRAVGSGLTAILFMLLAYVAFGQHLTGGFRHAGVTYDYFLEMQAIGIDGIFGSPLYVAASYAFLFVLFGNFYVISGGGKLFFDVAAALTGRMVGGPAKACVVSSGLYGMISGSPVADVATTGPVTIPIMKRIGISAERAGAIEAAASTGGAMMPPVMGAVAFIMSNFTGIPYYLICQYAALPAIGYYLGVFALVHFEAVRLDLGRVPEEQIVGLKVALINNWPRVVPIAVLIWLLIEGFSPAYIAAGSAVSVVVASWFSRDDRIGPRRFVEASVETCHSMVPLTAAVAAAGIIIGSIELTGLAGKFTLLLFTLSGGYLLSSLFLAAVVLVLLGMGMPTVGVYIMGIALLAPIFIGKFGLPIMDVHMFILFYACMSAITPPVAVAAFAAGAIAGANPFKLAPYACKLAVGGFVLPFYFLFNNGILLQGGSLLKIVSDTMIGAAVVLVSSVALHGYVRRCPIPLPLRGVFVLAALCMAWPQPLIQYAAAAVAGGLFLFLLRGTQTSPALSR